MAAKQSSALLSSLAARIMNGYEPTRDEIMSLAASVLSQDETPVDVDPEVALATTGRYIRRRSLVDEAPVDEAEAREADAAPKVK